MKKILNIACFICCLPIVGIAYLLHDGWYYLRYKKIPKPRDDEYEIRHQRKTTTYPDDQPDEKDWYNYIAKQIKNMKIIILIIFLTSCRVYKEQYGVKTERWNTRHLKKINGPKKPNSAGVYRSYAYFKHSELPTHAKGDRMGFGD